MKTRMFVTAAMSAICLIGIGATTVFGQTAAAPGTPGTAPSSATECKKNDECSDPTPICDVAKVCRARTSAEERATLDKAKRDVEKENVEAAEKALTDSKRACSRDATDCGDPIKAAEQRLAQAKREASRVGVGAATAVAGTCYDTHVSTCSAEPIRGTCAGSSQILRCPGVLAEINLQPNSGSGASTARLDRIESTLDDHGRRLSGVEGTQTALLDEADRTGAKADEAYAAAVDEQSGDREKVYVSPALLSPPAHQFGGSAGDVDPDRLSGCIGAKARFLKRDKRLQTETARQNAASTWCLASLNK